MLLTEYLGGKVLEKIGEKFEEYLQEGKLQKILLNC